MPLPVGDWNANVNGTEGVLTIEPLSAQGLFDGSLLGEAIQAAWDESSQSITFISFSVGGIDRFRALYSGCLFSTPPNPEPGRDIVWTLCGNATAVSQSGTPVVPAHARRTIFGWTAQIRQVI
jgi:hypothetical protein